MEDTESRHENRLSAIISGALTNLFENKIMENGAFGSFGSDSISDGQDNSPAVQGTWSSIEDFVSNNSEGKNGSRQKRYRMTKKQLQAGLSREDAFAEFNAAHAARSVTSPDTNN